MLWIRIILLQGPTKSLYSCTVKRSRISRISTAPSKVIRFTIQLVIKLVCLDPCDQIHTCSRLDQLSTKFNSDADLTYKPALPIPNVEAELSPVIHDSLINQGFQLGPSASFNREHVEVQGSGNEWVVINNSDKPISCVVPVGNADSIKALPEVIQAKSTLELSSAFNPERSLELGPAPTYHDGLKVYSRFGQWEVMNYGPEPRSCQIYVLMQRKGRSTQVEKVMNTRLATRQAIALRVPHHLQLYVHVQK
ncbi:hypothetical protein Pst134EA_031761 [Puccinia striiformis f. sp. tritici]|uniref:uncharacterized protein n=1 Tax=Puccinia striiformis f. sp. tritici TaxID=168172 RepID=UPI00200874CE|nr:uncharacterized protein Pst134EA_031761 [Puccinia striiformis f. sp. tritici]KAH9442604.1 hypothetical protein Pst134EA_031761 [Puccinia striiformis f. sp. tritici]